MATQTTGGGSTTSFTNTPQAGDDCFSGYDEDFLGIVYLDVMQNDIGGKAKFLWALDDGENDSGLMSGYEAADLLQQDLARMESTSTDTSENGAKVWITSDGKVGYDASTLSADFRADLNSLALGEVGYDSFIYAIRLANGTLSWARAYIQFTGSNDAPTVSAADNGSVVEDADDPTLSDTGTITFDDVDLSDTHAVDSVTPSGTNTLGGTLVASVTDAATGAGNGTVTWTYEVPNSATQYLGAGKTASETFTVRIKDNNGGFVDQLITVTIMGTNDEASIVVDANVTDDRAVVEAGGANNADAGDPSASGKLLVSDVDDGEAVFTAPTAAQLAGTYGTFTFDPATGAWTYTLNQGAADALNAGDAAGDSLTVYSADGTASHTINVAITGANDAAVINGTATGSVNEDGILIASGDLDVSDVDDSNTFNAASLAGTYGSLAFLADGSWTYTLNNDDADLADLDFGEQATEIFNVTSSDGTSHQIVITVNGANEGDPNDNDHMATSPTVVIMASGDSGAEILVGSSGNDTLMGGQANDTIYGGAGNDTIYGYDPTSSTNAADADLIYGGSGDDTIFGNQRNDIIYGGSGNDVIRGNGGSDTLFGGLGADQFVYDAPSDAVDTIMDFEHNVDKIVFDNAGFTGLTDGPLSASAFATGTAATTAAHRIIYNSLTGQLFYDADGSGAGAQILIAEFDNLPVLTASDFIVV